MDKDKTNATGNDAANNKISVAEFVGKYKDQVNDAGRKKLCQDIISRKYVPVIEKYTALLTGFENVNRKNGSIYINSFLNYIVYTMCTISMYTNLNCASSADNNGSIDNYDLLKESGALETILSVIGEPELKELDRINSMIASDTRENEMNLASLLEDKFLKYLKDATAK